jgi:glycosyltransferase involved in cell wall biosynthesis
MDSVTWVDLGQAVKSDVPAPPVAVSAGWDLTRHRPVLATGTKPPGVWFSGVVFGGSGYAEETREVVLGLVSNQIPVELHPMGPSSDGLGLLSPAVREALERLKAERVDPARSVLFQMAQASALDLDLYGRHRVARTMFETDRLPSEYLPPCQAMDEVWVPSRFNRETFVRAGVDEKRVRFVREGLHTQKFRPGLEPLRIPHARGFNFLSVFQWSQRKGPDVLLKAYLSEFKADEDVALILKTYKEGSPWADLVPELAYFVERVARIPLEKAPPIILLPGFIANADIPRLYASANAFVLATRGEGWGRPYAEALACGCPVIATGWSGHMDFLNDENSYLIDYKLVPTAPDIDSEIYAGHHWAEPDVDHLRQLMRDVFTHREEARRKADRGRAELVDQWDWKHVINIWLSEFRRLLQ